MGTTTNYSWPYPEATGLVKDGWEDIKDLATAIDTTASTSFASKIKNVVSASYSTETDNSTTTYADTGVTATITPSATSSKILVCVAIPAGKSSDNVNNAANFQILRGATQILENKQIFYTGSAIWNSSVWTAFYLDSPNTTSATTYKVQFKQWSNNGARVRAQIDNSTSTIVLFEVAG